MNLAEIYQLAIDTGWEVDPRQEEELKRVLADKEEEFADLSADEKEYFDQDSLENPYADTRILYGNQDKEVNRVLMGIDIDVSEILIADRLTEKGKEIDAIISHHPKGKALAALNEVMHMQEDILHDLGIPVNVAEGMLADRISEVERGIMPLNHNKARDAARLLDFPLLSVHTPADNLVVNFLQDKIDQAELNKVADVVDLLMGIPEYQAATKAKAGPNVVAGAKDNRAGKVVVDMTGGTGGAKEEYEKLAQAGVGTLVCMHIGEEHLKQAKEHHINVVIAGHMASDSIGMNLFADKLVKQGVEIIPCSGLIRCNR
ncbi:NGG1p interacting factor NIF3 [Halanaerobaculum tunisiense]